MGNYPLYPLIILCFVPCNSESLPVHSLFITCSLPVHSLLLQRMSKERRKVKDYKLKAKGGVKEKVKGEVSI